jgi:hypothetical protein
MQGRAKEKPQLTPSTEWMGIDGLLNVALKITDHKRTGAVEKFSVVSITPSTSGRSPD